MSELTAGVDGAAGEAIEADEADRFRLPEAGGDIRPLDLDPEKTRAGASDRVGEPISSGVVTTRSATPDSYVNLATLKNMPILLAINTKSL